LFISLIVCCFYVTDSNQSPDWRVDWREATKFSQNLLKAKRGDINLRVVGELSMH